MLRIGEFSVLSQISIYMLRHYNEIGLLIPEHIDQFTGYRYYSENQLPIANKIQALKNMGLSLSLIKEILTKYTTNDELKKYLELHAAEQRDKIADMQRQLNLIETTIENYQAGEKDLLMDEMERRLKNNPSNTAPLAVMLDFKLGTRKGEILAICKSDIIDNRIHIHRQLVEEFDTSNLNNMKSKGFQVVDYTKCKRSITECLSFIVNYMR